MDETSIEVNIITGQLDLIVATPGTVEWVNKVNWTGTGDYKNAQRQVVSMDGFLEGYVKKYGKFALYWINRAGHMVPLDNPKGMDFILRNVTKYWQF